MTGEIHEEHPFLLPEEARDHTRRFRGRLVAPVTVVTAASGEVNIGLTVSSLMVSEGEPPYVHFLIGEANELFDAISSSRRFVLHVLDSRHRALSEIFAGRRPTPGGMFAGLEVEASAWGPVIVEPATRAYCRLEETREYGFSFLVTGAIDELDVGDLRDPLAYFRGAYRSLD